VRTGVLVPADRRGVRQNDSQWPAGDIAFGRCWPSAGQRSTNDLTVVCRLGIEAAVRSALPGPPGRSENLPPAEVAAAGGSPVLCCS
jgi:hypothetical protein